MVSGGGVQQPTLTLAAVAAQPRQHWQQREGAMASSWFMEIKPRRPRSREDEDIRRLIPPPPVRAPERVLHHSRYAAQRYKPGHTSLFADVAPRSRSGPMGPRGRARAPGFLAAHSGELRLPPPRRHEYSTALPRRKAVPRCSTAPAAARRAASASNYMVDNAIRTMKLGAPRRAARPERPPRYALPSYGRTPEYLVAAREREREAVRRAASVAARRVEQEASKVRPMGNEARSVLVAQLKHRHATLQQDFFKTMGSVSLEAVDTRRARQEKERYEAQLEQLERALAKVMRPGPLWIDHEN